MPVFDAAKALPWARRTKTKIAARTEALGAGEILTDETGGLYVGDGVTPVSQLPRQLVKPEADGYYATKGDLNVRDFGAKGDGTTDDTTALRTAIAAAVAARSRLIWPPGTYRITGDLPMGTSTAGSTNWAMSGMGVTILQATDNTPIFHFTKELTRNFVIEGFEFAWAANQAASNTKSVAIYFDSDTNNNYGFYNFVVRNIILRNGYRGICVNEQSANTIPVWGANLHDWHHSSSMSGAAIRLVQTASGQPNIRLCNIYLRGDIATEEGIIIQGAGAVTLTNIEFNKYVFREMLITTCDSVILSAIRSEHGNLANLASGLWTFSDCRFDIRGWQVQSKTFSGGTGWMFVFRLIGGNTAGVIGVGTVLSLTITSPTQVALISGDASADIQFDGPFRNASGIPKVYKFDNTATHVSKDRGIRGSVVTKTASYTAGDVDDIIVCNGASVTITLPAPNATLSHPNRQYVVKNVNAAAATVVSAGTSQTIDGAASVTLAQWEVGRFLNTGSTWLRI